MRSSLREFSINSRSLIKLERFQAGIKIFLRAGR